MSEKSILTQLKESNAELTTKVQQLEMRFQAFSQIDQVLAEFRGSFEAVSRTVDTLVAEVGNQLFGAAADESGKTGAEKLDQLIRVRIREQLQGAMDQRRANNDAVVKQLVDAGAFAADDVITEDSYVVIDVLVPQPDGYKLQDRVQQRFVGYHPNVKEKLLGKGVGEVFTLSDGGEIKVAAIYKLLPPPAPRELEETPPVEAATPVEADPTQVVGGSDTVPEVPATTEAV